MTRKPSKNLYSIAGSLIKQNGGRVERSNTMSDGFNIKDHGQIRLQDDDTSAGTQRKVLYIILSSPFLISISMFFLLYSHPPFRCSCRTKMSQLRQ